MARGRRSPEEGNGRMEERRNQILRGAAAVFARDGYHRTRTRQIAEEAGVAEGTIYNYYQSKRELLLALIEHVVTESISEVAAKAEHEDLPSLLTAFLRDRLEMLDRNQGLMKAVIPEMISDREIQGEYLQKLVVPVVAQLAPLEQHVLATGELRPMNLRVAVPAIVGATLAAYLFNEALDTPMGRVGSREELVDELAHLFLNGLQAPIGEHVAKDRR